jgi:regulatory protein
VCEGEPRLRSRPMTATATSEPAARRVIGAIQPDPRRADCVRVVVGGRSLLTVSREVAATEHLAVGTELDEPLYARLCGAADAEAAYRTALRLLERRPFSARDLSRRLVLKGHPPGAASLAVERAERSGLIDDARFALHFVETRAARGRGPLRLRRDLAQLGVERDVVDRALAEASANGGSGTPDLEALARKRHGQLKGLPRPVARRRLLAYLARRGFAGDAVRRLVGTLVDGAG